MKRTAIISLGGSLIVPDGIDWKYLKKFRANICSHIKDGWKFIIISGGGRTARNYIDAAVGVNATVTDEDKDWLGIHATRLNAHLLRTIFRDEAEARISTNPHDLENFYNFREPILIAAGWRPGHSTDAVAVILAKYLDIKKIINLSNIDFAYDKDPKKFPDAKKIRACGWEAFRRIVGNRWSPGLSAPFDPVASRLAQETGLEVAIMNGKKLSRLSRYLRGETFSGTIIR